MNTLNQWNCMQYTEIEQDEYERIILLFEKFRFMGYTKNKLVI